MAHPRPTQAERVAAMRDRLLDATIECLVELGWGGTSTNEVVRRAGVSRGALAHHFPSKTALVVAAADRLLDRRAVEFAAEFSALPPEARTVPVAIYRLWSYFAGPEFAALLELSVAARTHPELRAAMADGPDNVTDTITAVFVDLFPDMESDVPVAELVRGAIAVLSGVALQVAVDGDRHGHHARTVEGLKALSELLITTPALRARAATPPPDREETP
jgi:AcrR family transcriptional regulator